jgi:nucleotide-binding universal stress UspA family protein
MCKTILAVVDGSSCSEPAAELALTLAQRTAAKLVFCFVMDGGPQFFLRQAPQIEEVGEGLAQWVLGSKPIIRI